MGQQRRAWEALIDDYARHLSAERGLSPHTVRGYRSDLRDLASCCQEGPGSVTLAAAMAVVA